MNADNIVHFENLWEMSEQVALKSPFQHSTDQVLDNIANLAADMKKFATSEFADEIKLALKKRAVGELLFLIATISARDNIDVYSALKDEMYLQELDLKSEALISESQSNLSV